jgi:RNA polymerase sigma-70 factor (ECF subfamily)
MDLDKLVKHFRGPLTGLIASWGASPSDAIDLCMDTFAECYLSRGSFRGDWNELASTGAWLRGIAYNLFRNHRRTGLRPVESLGERDIAQETPDPTGPEASQAERVRAAMDRLPGEQRTVLYMRYIENNPASEMAALLGVSERAVEGRLYRARKALAELLNSGPSSVDGMATVGRREERNE